ncbi:MAG: ComF family protein [Candidatus Eremiobacteraeota bacterium]|nr:ComF family protein [Candidatus Eremiobacteraeota bacterium]
MVLSKVLAALFPTRCAGCGTIGVALCAACLPPPRRSRPLMVADFEVRAIGRYCGPLRRAILSYKRGRRDIGDALSSLFEERLSAGLDPGIVLVPVPTVARRRRERGFDQSVRLAKRLGERSQRPVLLALRQVAGDAQRGRSRRARLSAVGRFACEAPALVCGARVVLVDDVVTTGATLADAARALVACGAHIEHAIVLAYA